MRPSCKSKESGYQDMRGFEGGLQKEQQHEIEALLNPFLKEFY